MFFGVHIAALHLHAGKHFDLNGIRIRSALDVTRTADIRDLDRPLPPGKAWSAALTATVPDGPGPHRLRIELVEQGIGRIPDADGEALILAVNVEAGERRSVTG